MNFIKKSLKSSQFRKDGFFKGYEIKNDILIMLRIYYLFADFLLVNNFLSRWLEGQPKDL